MRRVTESELGAARAELIASPSGYRMIAAGDGNAEGSSRRVSAAHLELLALVTDCFVDWLDEQFSATSAAATIAVGQDTRPSGRAIMKQVVRALVGRGLRVHWLGVCATPELLAYSRATYEVVAFICITASHNPLGYNGLKLGLGDGTILNRSAAAEVMACFEDSWRSSKRRSRVAQRIGATGRIANCRRGWRSRKRSALMAYQRQCAAAISGRPHQGDQLFGQLASAIRQSPCLVVADFNGGARAASVDVAMLAGMGITVRTLHSRPGAVAHRIVPEGDALRECAELLLRWQASYRVAFGYVCDNDGDRGNLVYYDPAVQQARSLSAQEGFALICMIELAWLEAIGRLSRAEESSAHTSLPRIAVVVNGPTSNRIDRIATHFGAKVHRAETGEAHVVALAARLRSEGWLCPLAGEGSNGGAIVYPSTVRDPLLSVGALLKMLFAQGDDGRTLLQIWHGRSGGRLPDTQPSVAAALAALPKFVTTPTGDARAALRLHQQGGRGEAHFLLKRAYERRFRRAWEEDTMLLGLRRRLGLKDWQLHHYVGSRELCCAVADLPPGDRNGGMKIILRDSDGRAVVWLWMRGSGTEPLFRTLVDIEGDRSGDERQLLDLHVALVRAAEKESASSMGR